MPTPTPPPVGQTIQMGVGQLVPPLTGTFAYTGGLALVDLTTMVVNTAQLLIRDENTGILRLGGGTWTVLSPATNGVAQYAWAVADTAVAGSFLISPKITVTINGVTGPLRLAAARLIIYP